MNKEQREKKAQEVADRINTDAKRVYSSLAEKFMRFLTDSDDPEGDAVKAKQIQLNAQWRTYCRYKGVGETGFNVINEFCESMIQEYRDNKKGDVLPEIEVKAEKPEPDISTDIPAMDDHLQMAKDLEEALIQK